ncbi:MAG: ABC transporter ATP-binding protein [Euryarchaeota archaeon]|nr:ABC transporter ATP-binding protein [Euryarchaeota archaeon]
MIRFERVTKRFGHTVALRDLTLEIEMGELFALVGPNGAGKTTAIRLMCGVLRPTSGRVTVAGMDVAENGTLVKRRIGYLPEEPSLYERMTPRQLLRFFASLYGVEDADGRIEALLELVGMLDRADSRIATFSKGMRQRVSIARALLHDPEILVLDEPTMGLDPLTAREIRSFVSGLKGRKTVLLCTHYLEEAEQLCSRMGILHRGRLVALGKPSELKSELEALGVESPTLADVFAYHTGGG